MSIHPLRTSEYPLFFDGYVQLRRPPAPPAIRWQSPEIGVFLIEHRDESPPRYDAWNDDEDSWSDDDDVFAHRACQGWDDPDQAIAAALARYQLFAESTAYGPNL